VSVWAKRADRHQLCGGYKIDAYHARIASVSTPFHSCNEPPMIVLHKLGSDERAYLSPAEASDLATALLAAVAALGVA
jgi:hypothetical protein